MKKNYSVFFLLSVISALLWSAEIFSQTKETNKKNSEGPSPAIFADGISSPKIKEPFHFPPLPVMSNTGNPEKDDADYVTAKEKWISEVLALFPKNMDGAKRAKIKEILRKENLEDVVQGKVLMIE